MSLADQQWCPTSAQVTVLQARGLRVKGKSGTNDAYAVMQVGKEKYQTSVVEKSVAPVWKEEAAFDLPQLQHGGGGGGGGGGTDRSTLHVHVLHRALVGPDKLLGQAVINLLQLSEDKGRNKAEWFKLLDKTGKADKDRGEVLVDIQFMRNNMTASMFDLSAAGKSRSRLGKFKDKVRGKKKESDAASTLAPSFTQVLTDSDEEGNGDGEVAAGKDEKKKKHKMKSLFSPKSNLQRNMSQSMSVLPAKNSSLSGSQTSGLNVDFSEGKKKFKFKIHKRSGSSDSKDSAAGHLKHGATEQSNLCINGSHIYCEEPQLRTSRIGSNFSLTSSGHGSMEDVPESSPPSVDSVRAVRQYSPWTEEEEETAEVGNIKEDEGEMMEEERIRMEEERKRREKEEERVRRQEEEDERLAEEKRRQRMRLEEEERQREEEERIRLEEEMAQKERRRQEEHKLAEEKRRLEEEERRIEEDKVKKEEEERIQREEEEERAQDERRRQEEEERARRQEEECERLAEEKRKLEEHERRRVEEEQKRQREEEERIRIEEERAQEERRQEECKLAEEKKRLEEEEKKRIEEEQKRQSEEEERIRMEEERAQEERARRQEEERKLAEEKRRLEEEERRRIEDEKFRKEEEERIQEERRKQEEDEMVRRQEELEEKRRLEEQEKRRREEEERKKREEEEKAQREKEEYERLVEEKRKLEEEERKRIEEEEKIREEERVRVEEERKRNEEESVRRQEEERERLAEEKRMLEEQERRRIEEEEKWQREEEERIRKEEERRQEEMDRKKREEHERLVEEKMRQEEQERRILEEERIRQEEQERIRMEKEKEIIEEEEKMKREEERNQREQKAEEEARKLEKEKLTRNAEEQKRTENKTKVVGTKSKVVISAEVTSTNPFDENFSNNPSEENPNSPDGVSADQQRSQSAVSLLGSNAAASNDERDLLSTQREKRPAPQPPGRNQAESQREHDGSTRHLAQINKQSKDKGVKTVSVLPQRSVQMIAPLSRSSADAENTQSLTQSTTTKGTTNVAKQNKRPAPSRPDSVEEGPSSGPKTALSSDGKFPNECNAEAKQEPVVFGLNPFEDDEDENELTAQDDTTANVSQAADKDAASQAKIKSSKKAHAPPLPAKTATTSNATLNKNAEGSHDTGDEGATVPDNSVTHPCDPEHVQETPVQESQPAGEKAGGKKEGPPSRRLQPVKPLNPLGQQPGSVVQGEVDNRSTGFLCKVQEKTMVSDTGLKGPYSQLTREELIALVLKQENQLSQRDKKVSELEKYIDNLLVRVMEEKPSILMSMNARKSTV